MLNYTFLIICIVVVTFLLYKQEITNDDFISSRYTKRSFHSRKVRGAELQSTKILSYPYTNPIIPLSATGSPRKGKVSKRNRILLSENALRNTSPSPTTAPSISREWYKFFLNFIIDAIRAIDSFQEVIDSFQDTIIPFLEDLIGNALTPVPSSASLTTFPSEFPKPSHLPSTFPSKSSVPSPEPSISLEPSALTSAVPSKSPKPSYIPSIVPSKSPNPSYVPSAVPSKSPKPSYLPSTVPSKSPKPSYIPSVVPSKSPKPSHLPSTVPSKSQKPSHLPSTVPSVSSVPSSLPSIFPTSLPEFENFTTTYDLDFKAEFDAFEDPHAKRNFESIMKDHLNQNYQETGLFLSSFTVPKNSDARVNRRRARGTGFCKRGKCKKPPSVNLTNKGTGRKTTSDTVNLFTKLDKFVIELPFFEYEMKYEEKADVVTYEADFHQQTMKPWESLEEINLSVEKFQNEPNLLCVMDKADCDAQLQSITAVFQQLQVDFDSNNHECSWSGVVCDDRNMIIELRVENENAAQKVFPKECTELHHLTGLYLANNAITGTLPPTLGDLKEIRFLSLENNKIKDKIPSELGLLTNMEELRLSRNEIGGSIPPHLGGATRLKILDLSRNKNLVGSIPPEFEDLENLKTLNLYDCAIYGAFPGNLKLLHLEEILLGRNRLTGNIGVFSNLPALKILDLAENNFAGTIPVTIENLQQLNVLNLYKNEMTGAIPPSLYKLSLLEEVILAKNDFNRKISTQIGLLTNLVIFDVADNDLTEELPSEIGNLGRLSTFNIHGNNFGNNIERRLPTEIGQLSELIELVISGNKFKGQLPSELGQNAKIEFLDIGHNFFSGTIPTDLNKLDYVSEMYIWGNLFTGNVGFLCDLPVFLYDFGEFDPSCANVFDQKHAIKLVYSALNQTYDRNVPECEWKGITCNNYGSIIGMNLAEENLDGSVHSAIGQLIELEIIDLSNNKLTGIVNQYTIDHLLMLENIDLSGNEVVVQIGDVIHGESHDEFGQSVVLSNDGNRLWVSGRFEMFALYVLDNGTWKLNHEFWSTTFAFISSMAVTLDGKAFVTGASFDADLGGTVIVFNEKELKDGRWVWKQRGNTLMGSASTMEFIGSSVAIKNNMNRIAVGAADRYYGIGGQYVEIFKLKRGKWESLQKFQGGAESKFGSAIAITPEFTRLIVGAPKGSGSAHLYNPDTQNELQVINGNGGDGDGYGGDGDGFGSSVSMSSDGSLVAIGAWKSNYVKVFKAVDDSLKKYEQIGNDVTGNTGSNIGETISLSFDGRTLAVGAADSDEGGTDSGKVYVYAIKDDDDHELMAELIGQAAYDSFGWAVSVSGDGSTVAVGAPDNEGGGYKSGSVRVFPSVQP